MSGPATGSRPTPSPTPAEQVADAVLAHPAVARLSGGPYGAIASYLPGRRLPGVIVGEGDEPVEIAVVLWFGVRVQQVARELRRLVSDLTGRARVDVTVADIAEESELAVTGPS